MSTRSPKRNISQESSENVSGCLVHPIVVVNGGRVEQDALVAGLFCAKSLRVENSSLENLRASLKK